MTPRLRYAEGVCCTYPRPTRPHRAPPQALGIVDRYSAAAARDVLKAVACLAEAAQGETLQYRDQLGEKTRGEGGCEDNAGVEGA